MRRLSAAGYKGAVAREIVVPDWWDEDCDRDPSLLPEVELRVARFVDQPLSVVRDPAAPIAAPAYPGTQLRRIRDIHRDRLGPAIHVGLRVAEAAIRCWGDALPPVRLPPLDPTGWRAAIPRVGEVVRLRDVVEDLWSRGIPVLHLATVPSPSFQGMACLVHGRPVIIIAHDLDEPARLAFVIAHEVAHVVNGDCTDGQPVVDEEDVVDDDHVIERRADLYSVRVLAGAAPIPHVDGRDPKALATAAAKIEKEHGVDAALVVRAWGKRNNEHAKATQAVHALYLMKGGKRTLREALDRHLDLEGASESDRALLRCLHGDPRHDAAAR